MDNWTKTTEENWKAIVGKRVLVYEDKQCYAVTAFPLEWKRFSHWIPVPEPPVELLTFTKVLDELKKDPNRKFKRSEWIDVYYVKTGNSCNYLTYTDMIAEDWIEIK